jgi:membrane protein implicated in regulation of membrane protease activity
MRAGRRRGPIRTVILIVAILLSFLVPWPWKLLVLIGGIVLEIGEVIWGRKLARRWRPQTGAEAMVGMQGEVVETCRPDGRVHVNGELWDATCPAGADVGDTVTVARVEGLRLFVDPLAATDVHPIRTM